MKHIRKFYESDKFIEPIDVEMDVIEFRKNFIAKIGEPTMKILDDLVRNNPTMTDDYKLYQIWDSDKSRLPDENDSVIKAVSRWHARIRLANSMVGKTRGLSVSASQYYFDYTKYACKEIDKKDVDKYIRSLDFKINSMSKKLEDLRKI